MIKARFKGETHSFFHIKEHIGVKLIYFKYNDL